MTEYMVVTQAICAAGILALGILTYTGRITKTLREEMETKFNSVRDEMRAGFNFMRDEMRADRATVLGEIKALRDEMHDMNGRLGRVEGHLGISATNSLRESQ